MDEVTIWSLKSALDSSSGFVSIGGAREHALVVFTGVSGSGKSSRVRDIVRGGAATLSGAARLSRTAPDRSVSGCLMF
jgi:hypothetical protein